MKTRCFFLFLAAMICIMPASNTQETATGRLPAAQPGCVVADQLLVKPLIPYSLATARKNSFLQKYSRDVQAISYIAALGWEVVQTHPGVDLGDLKKRLQQEPWVKEVCYNDVYRISEKKPSDYYFSYQYALKNEGKEILPPGSANNKSGKVDADIKAAAAWEYTTGAEHDVVVALIDTGVAASHEDLRNKVVKGYNFIGKDFDTEDDNGHGTFLASIIAAETNNGIGMAGVSWNAKIMPLKALDEDGEGDSTTIALAIRHAAEQGAEVINLSFGLEITPSNTLVEDACKFAYEKKCVLVAAAGNSGKEQVDYPAAYDKYCLAVGATDYNDQVADFSNYGPQIDVAAPGVYIWGAFFDPGKPSDLRSYKVSSLSPWSDQKLGTSCAAAYVTGAAALLLSLKPNLNPDQVMSLIRYTADDVNKLTYPGWDKKMGYGRLNLLTLLGPYKLTKGNDQLP